MKKNGKFRLSYLTKEGFRNLYVNRLMSIASISVLFSCLLIIGITVLALVNINGLLERMEEQNVIMVFMQEDATPTDITQLRVQIQNMENVTGVEFIDKDTALRDLLDSMGTSADLFSILPEDTLPHSYKVTVGNMQQFANTVSALESLPLVATTNENQELATMLTNLRNMLSVGSVAIILMLLIVSLFIISNTVRLTVFSRRLEINIMKSVGATNNFIRWPFIIEGILLGCIAGVLALFATWGLYELVLRSLSSILSSIFAGVALVPFREYATTLLLAYIGIGIITGVFGSAVSIRRYLKEKEFVDLEEDTAA